MPAPDNMKTALLKRAPERVNITFADGGIVHSAKLLEVLDDGLIYQTLQGRWAIVPYTALGIIWEAHNG